MQKLNFILLISFLIPGCRQEQKSVSVNDDKLPIADSTSQAHKQLTPTGTNTQALRVGWVDSSIGKYIEYSKNELIRSARKHKIKEDWLLDRIEKTDTADYLVFQVGHDVYDKGKPNLRFITDSWIYIDRIKKRLYEYNVPDDKLVEWQH